MIDLLFTNKRNLEPTSQRIFKTTIRKHKPVETKFQLKKAIINKETRSVKVTRKVNPLAINPEAITDALQAAKGGFINEAAVTLEHLIQKVTVHAITHHRKSKQ